MQTPAGDRVHGESPGRTANSQDCLSKPRLQPQHSGEPAAPRTGDAVRQLRQRPPLNLPNHPSPPPPPDPPRLAVTSRAKVGSRRFVCAVFVTAGSRRSRQGGRRRKETRLKSVQVALASSDDRAGSPSLGALTRTTRCGQQVASCLRTILGSTSSVDSLRARISRCPEGGWISWSSGGVALEWVEVGVVRGRLQT